MVFGLVIGIAAQICGEDACQAHSALSDAWYRKAGTNSAACRDRFRLRSGPPAVSRSCVTYIKGWHNESDR
jgi:hypothetical protein